MWASAWGGCGPSVCLKQLQPEVVEGGHHFCFSRVAMSSASLWGAVITGYRSSISQELTSGLSAFGDITVTGTRSEEEKDGVVRR